MMKLMTFLVHNDITQMMHLTATIKKIELNFEVDVIFFLSKYSCA